MVSSNRLTYRGDGSTLDWCRLGPKGQLPWSLKRPRRGVLDLTLVEMPMNVHDRSRRDVLKAALAAAAAAGPIGRAVFAADPKAAAPQELIKPSDPSAIPDRFKGLKVGVASYTFNKLPLDVT